MLATEQQFTDEGAGTIAIPLLSELVSIDTTNPPGNELAVARHVSTLLESYGIASEIDEFEPGRANLVATLKGLGRRPALVLSAHMDTLPIGREQWSKSPFSGENDGERIFGRGAADMKGAIAAMVEVLVDFASEQEQLDGDIILALSAGESTNCDGAKRLVQREDVRRAGAALVGEPTTLKLVTAEMGALWLRIVSSGRTGHSSGDGGVNAILQLLGYLAVITALEIPCPDHPTLPVPSMLVGRIRGGDAVNMVPDHCEAEIDIRVRPGTSVDEIIDLLKQFTPGTIDVELIDFKPPVETARDHPLVDISINACRAVHGDGSVSGVSYYSDATIFASELPMPFVIIGPGALGMSGRPDEYVDLENLKKVISIYRRIAKDWLCGGANVSPAVAAHSDNRV